MIHSRLKSFQLFRSYLIIKPLAIEIIGIGKQYGKETVLEQLFLSVEQGELLVILGDSGSGKSTLLKLMAGLEPIQSGLIRMFDVDQARNQPHNRDVALVFHDGNGYEHLTVRENLDLVAKKSRETDQITLWVDRLKLGATLNQKLAHLSGGQSQRVAIARAMLSGKSIILLDEPLTHLNQSLREEIRELILMVHKQTKRTFVYVTHDSDEAFYMASRIAILASGRIQQVADPRTIYCSPNSKEVAQLLGQPTIDILKLPSGWFESKQGAASSMQEFGLRSHDWKISRIEMALPQDNAAQKLGVSMTANGLVAKGAIESCRWMGSRWLIAIVCPERLRITCESPSFELIEGALIEAEKMSRTCEPTNSFGYLEASIPRSSIQPLG